MTSTSEPFAFDQDSSIRPVDPNRWSCDLSPAWNIEDNPNGGYVATPVFRAMSELAGMPNPLSITTHFLRPAVGGRSAEIACRVRRQGRTSAVVSGALSQDDIERVVCIGSFGVLDSDSFLDGSTSPAPPVLPPPDQCADRFGLEQGMRIALDNRVEVRLHPKCATAGQADVSVVAGWVRFADGRPPDTLALPLFADAFPPSLYASYGAIGWIPTLELTVHVQRRPVDGWIRARFECSEVVDDRVVEDGVLWDETGLVVARSRQLAQILRPRR